MNQVELGKTGLKVSELGFGGIPLTRCDFDQSHALITQALDAGVNFFDTAHIYGDSEEKMGRTLSPVRDQVIIATKSGARDAKTFTEQVELSFQRLQTDRIDLFQLHNVSTQDDLKAILAPGGPLEIAERLRDQGRFGHVGVTGHNPDIALEAIKTGRFATLQFPFNYVETQALDKLFPEARRQDMGLIGMKPLGGGVLDNARLCFGFLQENRWIVPIPGIQAPEELTEILGFYADPKPLSEDERQQIQAIKDRLGQRFCRRCGYCMPHCPQNIVIPFTLLLPSQAQRFATQFFKDNAANLTAKARDCIECGECTAHCPYNLPVPEMLKEVVEFYEDYCKRNNISA